MQKLFEILKFSTHISRSHIGKPVNLGVFQGTVFWGFNFLWDFFSPTKNPDSRYRQCLYRIAAASGRWRLADRFFLQNFKGHKSHEIFGYRDYHPPKKKQDFNGEILSETRSIFFFSLKAQFFFCNVRPPWRRCRYRWMKLAWKCRKLPSRWTPTTGKRVRDPEICPVNDDETLPETKKCSTKKGGWLEDLSQLCFFFPAIFRGVCC